jgi:hypothetical protein
MCVCVCAIPLYMASAWAYQNLASAWAYQKQEETETRYLLFRRWGSTCAHESISRQALDMWICGYCCEFIIFTYYLLLILTQFYLLLILTQCPFGVLVHLCLCMNTIAEANVISASSSK